MHIQWIDYERQLVAIFILLPGPCLCGCLCAEAPSSNNILLVADKVEDAVYFVNADTLEVESKVEVGRGPHEITVLPQLNRAYVTNMKVVRLFPSSIPILVVKSIVQI